MEYNNGKFKKNETIQTIHPNILKGSIIGKKSWGLWLNEWTDGIVEGSFTKYEILKQFEDHNIKIPESLLIDFNNRLQHKRLKYFKFI